MLVFIDESGDPGWKLQQGSSRFFCIALVVFEDAEDALACDQRIDLLRHELGWKANDEFHFKGNSDRVRRTFLEAVARYNFFYYTFILNKDQSKLWGEGFKDKHSFYKYACGLVFENAKDKLSGATVVIDRSGNLDFRKQLEKYLRRRMNAGKSRVICKVKMQRSSSNNLLQLADYVAGSVTRSLQTGRKSATDYRKMIAHREIQVRVWPQLGS